MLDANSFVAAAVEKSAARILPEPVALSSSGAIAQYARDMLKSVRESMTAPFPRKESPTYTLAQIADLCRLDKAQANYILVNKPGDLPTGTIVGGNRKREFSQREAMAWINHIRPHGNRPVRSRGKKIAVANSKGGVTKTTTTEALAQGLSIRGRKVLLVDLDPQASLTTMNGVFADLEVAIEQTIMPLIYGDQEDLRYAVQKTYWEGIDLIPACGLVSHADFVLPAMQMQDKEFEFWDVLNQGLEPLLDEYDVIIIDTPPTLSYLTLNAIMAADGLIIPSPPNALDYASSIQFWTLFSDFSKVFMRIAPGLNDKKFDFVNVLISKVEHRQQATAYVRDWIRMTYKGMVMKEEISYTGGALAAAAQFGTPYDVSGYSGENKIYKRTREEYDVLAETVDNQLMALWEHEETHRGN